MHIHILALMRCQGLRNTLLHSLVVLVCRPAGQLEVHIDWSVEQVNKRGSSRQMKRSSLILASPSKESPVLLLLQEPARDDAIAVTHHGATETKNSAPASHRMTPMAPKEAKEKKTA